MPEKIELSTVRYDCGNDGCKREDIRTEDKKDLLFNVVVLVSIVLLILFASLKVATM